MLLPFGLSLFLQTTVFLSCLTTVATQNKVKYDFPPNFLWATATAAFQVEGATREDGRGLSIWDTYQRVNGSIQNGDTADITDDSYHKYKEDVKLMKQLGTKAYRLSFSWSRIFPSGRNETNPKGVRYYHDLLDELINNDIVPMVTLYHWDLPQALQDLGGWLHPDVSQWMADYARFCFQEYGSKVPYWFTINEARRATLSGYGNTNSMDAPGLRANGDWAEYVSGHNMNLAHGKIYRVYEKEFKEKFGGNVGMANCLAWMEPLNDSDEDREAVEVARDIYFGQYVDPMISGDYSPRLKDFVRKQSLDTGRVNSILPDFSDEEKQMMKGTFDFIGLNYYFTLQLRKVREDDQENGVLPLHWGAYATYNENWKPVGPEPYWIYDTPFGLYNSLMFIKDRFGDLPIMITENGCMDTPGEGLNDTTRIHYLQGHIEAVGKAIADGVNVTSYALWSLLDNYEWGFGFGLKFGLHQVDFSDPDRRRTPKASAQWYKELIEEKAGPSGNNQNQNSQNQDSWNQSQNQDTQYPNQTQNQNQNQDSQNVNQNQTQTTSQIPSQTTQKPNQPQYLNQDTWKQAQNQNQNNQNPQNPVDSSKPVTSGNIDDSQNLRPIQYPNADNEVQTQRTSTPQGLNQQPMQNGPQDGPKEETKPPVPTTTTVNRGDLPLFELGKETTSSGNGTSSSDLRTFSILVFTSCVILNA